MSEHTGSSFGQKVTTILIEALAEEEANVVKAEEELARSHSAFLLYGERAIRLRGALRCLGHESVPLPEELGAEAIRELKQIERRVQAESQ
jgi:hypothetical protein